MIRILELIDGGFIGGGQTHILSLVKCLDKEKYEPVISASGKGEFRPLAEKSGFKFEPAELPKFYRKKYLGRIDEIVKKYSIEIIHSHGGVAGMYARFYKKNFENIKTLHTIHGIHYINSSNIFRKYFSLSIEQYLTQFTDGFICVSHSDRDLAEKLKIIEPSRTTVIHNGIDLDRFSSGVKNKILMKEYGIEEGDTVIGNISRFDFQKNQRYIIRNCAELLKKHPRLKILLAGEGKYLDECKKIAEGLEGKDRIIFPGSITNTEDHYSLFDVYVFPTLWEGLSISMIEAMACGRCIVASDIPSNKELIVDGVSGYLFNINDRNVFKEKIDNVINRKDIRDKLSDNAFRSSKIFSEKIMTEKTEEEYIKLNRS
ncbi:MAG: glycosyltransferase family 4 protein [Ignavibacteria bacterium]|nr:glycosyltransferase family 4 protein [Ignavibacteria bacterium]